MVTKKSLTLEYGAEMRDVVIVDAARTPVGKYRGGLSGVRADALGSAVLDALRRRTSIDPTDVDDVIFGCVTQVGEQCGNIARTALLGAGWPDTIPGMTVDRKCGSSESAIHTAFAQIAAGVSDIVIAGGAESMTRVRMGGNRDVHGEPFGRLVLERHELVSQGEAAERVADKWSLTREELDNYALESHQFASAAADRGYFDSEIIPVSLDQWGEADDPNASGEIQHDETIRRETDLTKLGGLKTVFRPDGRLTAGNSSQISDGAAALVLMSLDAANAHGLDPIAKLRAVTTVGADPTMMLTGPIPATKKVLEKAELAITDIDLFEVNEAFASVPLMWAHEFDTPREKLNVNGGAIALGHPLGASGARLMTTLVHELRRRGARFGLQTMCCAGGLATATVVECI